MRPNILQEVLRLEEKATKFQRELFEYEIEIEQLVREFEKDEENEWALQLGKEANKVGGCACYLLDLKTKLEDAKITLM